MTLDRDNNITLQVNDKQFTVQVGILCKSAHYFEALLFGPAASSLDDPNRTAGGALIVHANADVFRHIIEFCDLGIYPLFWSSGSFDLGLYAQLLQQANYFQVDKLANWINDRGFERAVKVEIKQEVQSQWTFERATPEDLNGAARRSIQYFTEHSTHWRCPRSIYNHLGPAKGVARPDQCGNACEKAGGGEFREVSEAKVLVVVERPIVKFEELECCE